MRSYIDTYQHKGLRRKLVDLLREKNITDENVLRAVNNVPRHFFLDSAFDHIAYENRAFPIGEGQTISHPYTVAYQSQLLEIKPNDKVLEVGTGSIYQATILAEMGATVYTIERQRQLYDKNKNFILKKKYPNIKFFYGDGFQGLPTYAPFNKIIITAGAPFIPPKLLTQLKIGGVMIIPVDAGTHQQMVKLTKKAGDSFEEERFESFSFVPMLEGKAG